jgi:hypothetical protein
VHWTALLGSVEDLKYQFARVLRQAEINVLFQTNAVKVYWSGCSRDCERILKLKKEDRLRERELSNASVTVIIITIATATVIVIVINIIILATTHYHGRILFEMAKGRALKAALRGVDPLLLAAAIGPQPWHSKCTAAT